ncbi:nucleotidyltransferase domain-containing protein [Candidatus Woesearchaeota archaeon]|nr:nucleotidyltransferase domain-containing protein [Candidatus Woesearchaeota archaeon]
MELSKISVKILRALLEAPLHDFKEIELINKAKVGKGSASDSINRLVESNVLKEKRIGKAKIISLNLKSQSLFLLKGLFDAERLSHLEKNKLTSIILFKRLIKRYTEFLLVFGSTVAGTYSKESDIDLLVVTKDLNKVKAERKNVEELFGERFNLHVYTEEEIRKNLKAEGFLRNSLLNGILIYGEDLGMELLSSMGIEENIDIQRLIFLNERVSSARKNYLNQDSKAASEILEKTLEQIIFYLLSRKGISYTTKKDAKKLVKKTAEGRLIERIENASLKDKIHLGSELILNILKEEILKDEGYERKD